MSAPLSTLRAKLARRKKARERQTRLWKKTGKAGHGKAAKAHTRAIKKLKSLIKRYLTLHPPSGKGRLAGCRSIINNEVVPVARKYDAPITSRKRAANDPLTLANPGSDHNAAIRTADAIDLGTVDGSPLAFAIAHSLGITGYSTGNYNGYYIERAGNTYRVQILWAVSGHYDHVHVGVKLS